MTTTTPALLIAAPASTPSFPVPLPRLSLADAVDPSRRPMPNPVLQPSPHAKPSSTAVVAHHLCNCLTPLRYSLPHNTGAALLLLQSPSQPPDADEPVPPDFALCHRCCNPQPLPSITGLPSSSAPHRRRSLPTTQSATISL
ncbi:hypothetical protein M0R45_035613 [Rubus argutus]|uniref:Uncharacterized protein n=1 Tax=Rubus argutus TaxID=59490 RepID=A0AAW1VWI1_RUBAR